jgi:hypothetical protein
MSTMIKKARNSYLDDGFSPILWGGTITLCAFSTLLLVQFNVPVKGFVSPWLLVFVSLAIQLYYNFKQHKNKQVKTWNETAMSYVWGAFGACMLLGTFVKPFLEKMLHVEKYNSIDTFSIFLLYGFPTFVTGGIMKFKPMVVGGIICFGCAIASIYVRYGSINNDIKHMLAMLLVIIAACSAWLIPGIILRRNYNNSKKINHV